MRIAAVCLFLAAASALQATNYAVVIGIGTYGTRADLRLDGPPRDADSVEELLVDKLGFLRPNIVKLVDAKATRTAILGAIKSVSDRVKPGDRVFIYFSGHGTSAFDPKAGSQVCTQVNSGCLIPFDVSSGTPAQVIDSLLIGSRDLRPIFTKIDESQPESFFVVFDSCYSENAAKSIGDQAGTSKDAPLSKLATKAPTASADSYDAAFIKLRPQTARTNDPYPYTRMVYLSASAQDEKAFDISQRLIAGRQAETVDTKPHGRFTNQLLRAFQKGDGDLNRDGKISYAELHQFTMESLQGLQTPQLRLPEKPVLLDSPVLEMAILPNSGEYVRARHRVRVRVTTSASELEKEISGLPGIEVKEEVPDFVVSAAGGKYQLSNGSGLELRQYAAAEKRDLLQRLAAEPKVREIFDYHVNSSKARPAFTLLPAGKSHFAVGSEIAFEASAPAKSYFLMLNIDTDGVVTVVYPGGNEAIGAVTSRRIPAAVSGPPTGAEYMKLFTFPTEPEGYRKWAGAQLAPGSSTLNDILKAVKTSADGDAALTLYSIPRK